MSNIAVILPVYNEAETIARTIREWHEKVIARTDGAELIITEDGSRDGTKGILKDLQKKIPFRLISGEARKGYTKAFKDALALPDAPLIFFTDSDGQHDPEDFDVLLKAIKGCDVAGGRKSPRRDPLLRLVMSKVYNALIGIFFGVHFNDINAGFKLIRKEVRDKVLPEVVDLEQCVMSEFILKAHMMGFRIREVPVRHRPREAGSSIFNARNLPGIVLRLIRGLLRIRRSRARYDAAAGTRQIRRDLPTR